MFYFKHSKRRSAINLDSYLDFETAGKWIVFGERSYVGKLWKNAKKLVKSGEFYEVKFMRTKSNREGKRYALLVYADENNLAGFYNVLKGLDFNLNPRWISNDFTRRRRKFRNLVNRLRGLF